MRRRPGRHYLWKSILNMDQSVVERCLASGTLTVEERDFERNTLLHGLAKNGYLARLEFFLKFGPDVNAVNGDGDTPLLLCCKNRKWGLVAALVRAGADPDVQNCDGDTALMLTVTVNRPQPVDALLKAGANVDLKNREGSTALTEAVASRKLENVSRLVLCGGSRFSVQQRWRIAVDCARQRNVMDVYDYLRDMNLGDDAPVPSAPEPKGAECVVCLEAADRVALVPCGHVCCCSACAAAMKGGRASFPCPLCKMPAVNTLKLYFS